MHTTVSAPNGIAIGGDNNGAATVNNNYGPVKRTLSVEQKIKLKKSFCTLPPYVQSSFTIEALANIEDAQSLMWELSKLLQDCGRPVAHPIIATIVGEQPAGVSVRYSGSNPQTFFFANALNLALNNAKIDSSLIGNAESSTDSVTVMIGTP